MMDAFTASIQKLLEDRRASRFDKFDHQVPGKCDRRAVLCEMFFTAIIASNHLESGKDEKGAHAHHLGPPIDRLV